MTHHLKILPNYFEAVWSGDKRAELRKDDRGYEVGDVLHLHEWDGEKYTGNAITVTVTHILRRCSTYGLMDGYCILSIGNPRLDKQEVFQFVKNGLIRVAGSSLS